LNAAASAAGIRLRVADREHADYEALNATLDTQITAAKQELRVRLLGDALPFVPQLETVIAAWSLSAARAHAWRTAVILAETPSVLAPELVDSIDGLAAVVSKSLLIPVPNVPV